MSQGQSPSNSIRRPLDELSGGAVFERDGWRCCSCRTPWGGSNAIISGRSDRGGDPWDLDNLQTLCRDCHIAKTAA